MKIGNYRIEVVSDAEFYLDGGAMFGVVPRILWQREIEPDSKNRIRMATNCLFIETPDERILIETGLGEKWTEKQTEIYGIKRNSTFADRLFEATGCKTEDITIVINTHLHFDHAGGNTINIEGRLQPQFPNAKYLVSASELQHAENPSERDRASYLAENWRPLLANQQLVEIPDVFEAVPGLKLNLTRGHSETMQTWSLELESRKFFGFADLIPMRHHLRPAWIAAYDLFPLETLEFKKTVLPKAVEENWNCLFYHDPEVPLAQIASDGKNFTAKPLEH
ncbi:MAG TPA: MBL fold metallo-hydrolase [Pyrinomonadaceae bacterium]|nr:MBL fold metallo-hydrolase [Pyrinomonadaceae bacterium]